MGLYNMFLLTTVAFLANSTALAVMHPIPPDSSAVDRSPAYADSDTILTRLLRGTKLSDDGEERGGMFQSKVRESLKLLKLASEGQSPAGAFEKLRLAKGKGDVLSKSEFGTWFQYVTIITNKNDWEKATIDVLSKHHTDKALVAMIQKAKTGKREETANMLESALFSKWFDEYFLPMDAMKNVFNLKMEAIKSTPDTAKIWNAYSDYFYKRRPDLKVF
ncbi:hypothetical protein GQ600_12835 [Phytophthora cactorum]|nr:hypothetical protein GQ600_12835 [Phytophthora cactorum]